MNTFWLYERYYIHGRLYILSHYFELESHVYKNYFQSINLDVYP